MNKLRRSRSNRMILGVCGGIAEYLNIDATIIRIIWLLIALPSFGTLGLAYLVCGFVIPEDDGIIYQDENPSKTNNNSQLYLGLGIILIGVYLLAKIFFPWINLRLLNLTRYWPVLLILLGIYIIINHKTEK